MSTIQGPVTYTPTGQALARAAKGSYGNKTWENAREIMRDSFESIAQSPNTSPSEKAIADLGLRVGAHTMTHDNAASARYSVMQTIAGGVPGPIGAVLAQSAVSAYGGKQWDSARAISLDGLQTVLKYSPDPGDKALAQLGVDFGSHQMTHQNAATARLEVLRTIAAGSEDEMIGQVLARTTLSAFGEKTWDAARAISRDGLKAIAKNETTSPQEKALASLGITFGGHTMPDQDAATARLAVLRELSKPLSGDLTDNIAKVSLTASGGQTWSSARAILKDGFEAILANPKASTEEKELAQLGIQLGANRMPDDQATNARLNVMRQIRDL